QSADQLARTYMDSSDMVGATGKALSDSYSKMTEAINQEYLSTTQNGKTYVEQLEVMTKNLTALNNVYELQLQGTNEQFEASKQLYSGLDEIMANLKNSAEDTKRYRDEIGRLSQNLAAMNTIYGNMLSAMNVKIQD
ncbi:MAG: gliding motility protein GldL, partial [Bacteroidales bacterium]|nr:gliding motility protein GldL [Bacteroidales bacterium]